MKLPLKPTFEQKGLKGYLYPLKNKELEIFFVDVTQGHDTYIISKKCFHIYYIIEGEGIFYIDSKSKKVSKNSLIEVQTNIEYTYSGNMKLLLIMNPPWFEGNEEITKKNPDVK
jgi:mannose-6-phosphate isomerase-like protein (cupin superfamily)